VDAAHEGNYLIVIPFGKIELEKTADDVVLLAQRVLRLELQLDHQKEQQATERENFKLQIENVILRSQRGLPPADSSDKTE
jgi:hypothetical protein